MLSSLVNAARKTIATGEVFMWFFYHPADTLPLKQVSIALNEVGFSSAYACTITKFVWLASITRMCCLFIDNCRYFGILVPIIKYYVAIIKYYNNKI